MDRTTLNEANMKTIFKAKIETKHDTDEYERYYEILEDVIPESITGNCPHCGVYSLMRFDAVVTREGWSFDFICSCSHCNKSVFVQAGYVSEPVAQNNLEGKTEVFSVYPFDKQVLIPKEVPDTYCTDYREAKLIVSLSPNASAALSRRILQNILREEFKIEKRSLASEIDEFLKRDDIPSYISDAVDAVRNIGNFAAHPSKNKNTGEIVDVEPGEAEWLLEVLDALFDFVFVQPVRLDERRQKLNAKLENIGKPPIK